MEEFGTEKNLIVRVGFGDAYALVAAEGSGYSPDLVHDMSLRVSELFAGMLNQALVNGMYMPYFFETDEESEEEETDEEEEATVTIKFSEGVDDGGKWWE